MPQVDLLKGATIPTTELRGEIRFNDVSFEYPTRPGQIVLRHFNLTLLPGQTVALVGSSGSGKSTVASLLERFYEPSSGSITIDGHDLKGEIWFGFFSNIYIIYNCVCFMFRCIATMVALGGDWIYRAAAHPVWYVNNGKYSLWTSCGYK